MSRQARALDVLLAEVNTKAPNRSKVSDGGLGDQAHASRTSDHNPNAAGVWRARDVTNDPTGGMSGQVLSRLVAAKLGKIPALGSGAYVIFNHQIISRDRLSEGWRHYSGSNAHEHHVHVSVATAASGYDSNAAWNLFADAKPERPAVPERNDVQKAHTLAQQALDKLRAANYLLRAAVKRNPERKAVAQMERHWTAAYHEIQNAKKEGPPK